MMADSGPSFVSLDGEAVDALVLRAYGRQDGRLVERVLDANPGLAGRGVLLPAGVEVICPPLPVASARDLVRLWD